MLLLAAGCRAPPPAPAPRTPVVLITLDTTRADHLGAYGHTLARTPHLDALAARGLRFERAFTPVPLTIPAHTSLFTGLWPPRHGVRDNGDHHLSSEATTLAERLQAQGWRTHAAVGAFVTQSRWGFGQGFDGYDEDLGVSSDRLSWVVERPADAVVDDALAALGAGVDFLWVHLFDAHSPYQPPEPFHSQHPGRPYDGELAWLDHQLGRLLEAVPEHAIVVVAGDHGEALGEGEPEHGLLVGEATTRVPLLLVAPGVAPGVVQRPVSLVDITPTLLRLTGLPVPAGLDGQDLVLGGERPGVYSETRYGAYHFGFSPLEALRGPEGEVVRGARLEQQGAQAERLLAELDRITTLPLDWAPATSTLDSGTLAQLQALGYVSTGPSAPGGVDPRDGMAQIRALFTLRALPPAEQEPALRALLQENPGLREARTRLGMLLVGTGRVDEGRSELLRCQQEAPSSSGALVLGELWMQSGDPTEALIWYEEALRLDPRSLDARAGRVQALVLTGHTEEAAAQAEQALALAPDHADVLIAAALVAIARGDPPHPLLGPLEELARRTPGTPGLQQVLATLRQAAGDELGAEEALREELGWWPGSAPARVQLARLLLGQGRQVEAYKALRPLLAMAPEDPAVNALAAEILLAMGRPDRAAPHLTRCAGWPGCPTPGSAPSTGSGDPGGAGSGGGASGGGG